MLEMAKRLNRLLGLRRVAVDIFGDVWGFAITVAGRYEGVMSLRRSNQLRPTSIEPYPTAAPGSVIFRQGNTQVLCTASIASEVPPWLIDRATGQATRGWVTAEYAMLPGSTAQRKRRGPDSRGTEIQRLIARVLRAAVDLRRMPGVLITCDCDVLCADGGTRTAAIT